MALRRGDKGKEVLEASKLLVDVGLLRAPQDTYDQRMELAVRAWQHHGVGPGGRPLAVDGVFGPNTRHSLVDPNADRVFEPLPCSFDELFYDGDGYATAVVNTALREMEAGAREIGDNNQGTFVDKYHRTARASQHKWAWCAAFTSWCFWAAAKARGKRMPFTYTGGAQALFKDFKRRGWSYDPQEMRPEPGDIVVWWRGATRSWQGHVGIVWGCLNDVVYVIEGNVGRYPAHVRIFSYKLGEMDKLIGFGRVPSSDR